MWDKNDWHQFFAIANRPWQRHRPPRPVYPSGLKRVLPAIGFSLSELDDAGINVEAAERLGLPVDVLRVSGSHGSPMCPHCANSPAPHANPASRVKVTANPDNTAEPRACLSRFPPDDTPKNPSRTFRHRIAMSHGPASRDCRNSTPGTAVPLDAGQTSGKLPIRPIDADADYEINPTLPSAANAGEDAQHDFDFPQREAAFFYGLFLRGHSAEELRRDIEVPQAVLLGSGAPRGGSANPCCATSLLAWSSTAATCSPSSKLCSILSHAPSACSNRPYPNHSCSRVGARLTGTGLRERHAVPLRRASC